VLRPKTSDDDGGLVDESLDGLDVLDGDALRKADRDPTIVKVSPGEPDGVRAPDPEQPLDRGTRGLRDPAEGESVEAPGILSSLPER
jgi:hypothetical protein